MCKYSRVKNFTIRKRQRAYNWFLKSLSLKKFCNIVYSYVLKLRRNWFKSDKNDYIRSIRFLRRNHSWFYFAHRFATKIFMITSIMCWMTIGIDDYFSFDEHTLIEYAIKVIYLLKLVYKLGEMLFFWWTRLGEKCVIGGGSGFYPLSHTFWDIQSWNWKKKKWIFTLLFRT